MGRWGRNGDREGGGGYIVLGGESGGRDWGGG